MKQLKYDVAVIGAGLGGLTTAALLAKAGFKVLVSEKLPFTGGRCGTINYQGYKLPTGTAWVSDEVHGTLCREVGGEFEVRIPPTQYFFRIRGKDESAPFAGLYRAMIARAARDEGEAGRIYSAFKKAVMWAEPSRSISFYDWLRQYTDNPAIFGVFQIFIEMDSALNHSELPAGEFFRFIKETSFVKRMGFAPYGGGYVTDILVKAIRMLGGDVCTRSRALKIKVKDGNAAGIIIRKDTEEVEVTAQAVVCNAHPRVAVELAGADKFDSGSLKDISSLKGSPQVIYYITSDRPLLEDKPMICLPEARRIFAIMQYSHFCPEMSPKGKHLIEAAAFLGDSNPPYDFKKEMELQMQDIRENIKDFDKYAKIMRINWYRGPWGLMRAWAGHNTLPIHSPVQGLYLTGDSSAPSGWWGSSAAVKSGRLTAEDITRRYKPA